MRSFGYRFLLSVFCVSIFGSVHGQRNEKLVGSLGAINSIEQYFHLSPNQLVTLQPNGNWIWLTDFTVNPHQLDSVTCSSGLGLSLTQEIPAAVNKRRESTRNMAGRWIKQDSVFVYPNQFDSFAAKIQYLQIWKNGESAVIPVRLSEKVWKVFRIPASGVTFKKVQIKGTFNAWNPNNLNLTFEYLGNGKSLSDQGFWVGGTWVGPGTHQYVVVADGREMRDPSNKDSVSNGMGGWNSTFTNATKDYFLQQTRYFHGIIDGKSIEKQQIKNSESRPGSSAAAIENHWANNSGEIVVFGFQVSGVQVQRAQVNAGSSVPSKSKKKGATKAVIGKQNAVTGFVLAMIQNHVIPQVATEVTENNGIIDVRITFPARLIQNWSKGNVYLRVWFADKNGVSNDVMIPMKDGEMVTSVADLADADPRRMIMYNPMIDRFVDGNIANNKPLLRADVSPKVDFYGGDVKGITAKIKEGYFTSLGVNTIWISPVVKNPQGPYGQWVNPATKFSGYHGYWPVSLQQTDDRFCTEAELKEFIDVAHANGMKVLIDYVAHHIHQEHPLYKQKPEWFTPLILPDGSKNTERWDDYRLTTWFDDFMPTFNYFKPEVVDALTDTAMYWFHHYPVDGFRHDATKHIPDAFWRSLTLKMKQQILIPTADAGKMRNMYQIGETYGSAELIGSYLGSGLLDAQFDFNMYDAAVNAFKGNRGMNQLANTLTDSRKWYGSHHLMGNISGNQDKPRIMSLLDGSLKEGENTKQVGWDREIQINDSLGYARLLNMMAFNMIIPGVPVIYYGDEIGMPGANDPDSRRLMRFDKGLQSSAQAINKKELYLRNQISSLTNLRNNNMALLYGNMVSTSIGDSVLVIDRTYLNQNVIGIINNGNSDVYVVIKKRKGESTSALVTWVNLVSKNDFFAIPESAKGSVATKDKGEEGLSFIGGNIYPMHERAPFGYNSLKNCTQYRILGWKSHPEIDENCFVVKVPAHSFDYLFK